MNVLRQPEWKVYRKMHKRKTRIAENASPTRKEELLQNKLQDIEEINCTSQSKQSKKNESDSCHVQIITMHGRDFIQRLPPHTRSGNMELVRKGQWYNLVVHKNLHKNWRHFLKEQL